MKTFIIAEAGVNHNGDMDIAKKLIDVAVECGVDAVKFQTFKAENLVTDYAALAEYQKSNEKKSNNQLEMLKKLQLSFDNFKELQAYCKGKIKFLTTAFDFESLNYIIDDLKIDIVKIPSGEITNLPYLLICAKSGLPIILSTGMAEINEVAESVKILRENGCKDLTILHCSTEYPAPKNEVNLLAMQTMQKRFHCNVGYSDHTQGCEIAFAAVALGAKVIEKHFTLDKTMDGPDHAASLNPAELKHLVEGIRNIESALGSGEKKVSTSELKNKDIARKSIVAKCDIAKGTIYSNENLSTKRPGTGISPMRWDEIIGKKAARAFKKDEQIELG